MNGKRFLFSAFILYNEEPGHITLRMVKVPLLEDHEEVLITNLPSKTFDSRQTENFTGTKPILLLQDIYSTIYISNLAGDIIRDAETELDEFQDSQGVLEP